MSDPASKLSFADFGLDDPAESEQLSVAVDVEEDLEAPADDLEMEMADAREMMSDGEVTAREQIDMSREVTAASVSSDWMNVAALQLLASGSQERVSATRYARASISARRFTGLKADVALSDRRFGHDASHGAD